MNIILAILTFIVLGFLFVGLFIKLIESIINIGIYEQHKKDFDTHYSGFGVVFNSETGKLESSGSKFIFPF